MIKFASLALTSALGLAAIVQAAPAEARPYVSVGIGLPGVVVAPLGYAPGYYAPYYYGHGPYWRHDYDRGRYERFPHAWGHEGGRRGYGR